MGDFLKQIFGGSDSEQQSTSGPIDVTSPEVEKLRATFSETLTSLLGGGGRDPIAGVPTQPGATPGTAATAPVSTQEQFLLDLIGKDAASGERRDLISQTLQGQFLPGGEQSNPFLEETIRAAQRPTLEGLEETLGRALPGKFALAGQESKQKEGSSAFDRAAAIQSRGTAQALADIATNISFGSQEAERARQQGAATIGQAEVEVGIEQLQASALPRLIEQFGLTKGSEEFQARITAVLQALQIATGTPLQQIASESQSTGSSDTATGVVPAVGTFFSVNR